MAGTGFEPDVKVRTREYRIGCIGAGMIMAECHLAAYKEAGFPVVAIASRTKANAEKVAERWGIPTVHDTPEAADRGHRRRDHRPRLSARPAAGADPPRAEAAAHQGDPGAEAAGAVARGGDQAARRGGEGRQDPLGQPEHALRPVDARAEADHRQRRARRDRLRADRHARDPALAGLPRGLRPADARQHERASSRRAALPVRRSRRDHHADAQGSAHDLRPFRRHHRLDADASRPACWPCRWRMSGPARARRATRTTSTSTGASTAPRASPRARSAGRRAPPRR